MLGQQVINGLTMGCVYGLVALGYSLIYGVLGLINFAHGEVYMVGAFLAFTGMAFWGWGFYSSLLFVLLATCVLGAVLDRLAYAPLRRAPRASQLISALAMSIVLRNTAMLIWGTRTVAFPQVFGHSLISLWGIRISWLQLAVPAVTVILMVGLHVFVRRTRLGKAVRATSLDMEMASVMGINPDTIIGVVFSLGAALGGLAGVLVANFYGALSFDMGVAVGLRSFVAAVLGGIGSINGAMLGGVLLGVAETVSAAYLSPAYKDALAFIILTAVLLVKPTGLFGMHVEKGG